MDSVATIMHRDQPANHLSISTGSGKEPATTQIDLKPRTPAGISSEVADCVARSVAGVTIRALRDEMPEGIFLALGADLEACAKQYTGCPNTKEMTFDESVEFVLEQFNFLNIGEIRLAFRLAAAGYLEGVSLRAYYGTFTVGMLGEVLAAYREYRDELVKQARRMENEAAALDTGEARKKAHDMEAWETNRMKVLLMLHEPTADNCTAYDYDFLTRRGEINLNDDEKKAMFQRRYDLVVREMYRSMEDATPYRKREMLNEIEQAKQGKYTEGFRSKMTVAGKRLAVLDWIENKSVQHQ